MKIPEKVDIDNAHEYSIRCNQALHCIGQFKDEAIKALFKEPNMTMEKIDKNIEIILREYYITGNQIIDYYKNQEELAEQ